MEQVPQMISTKDLSYISDIFDWNFIAAKTANNYSLEVQDEEIKDYLDSIYETHKKICEDLVNILTMEETNE